MKLFEFFGVPVYQEAGNERPGYTKDNHEKMEDDLYYYILDHDRLHKECFMPLAQEIAEKMQGKNFDRKEYAKKFMPMVNRACMEYYKQTEMTRDPRDIFTKEIRMGICERLADQSFEDIGQGEYKLK